MQLFLPAAEAVEKRFPTAGEMRSKPPHWSEWSEVLALWEYRQGHFPQALSWGYYVEGNPVDDTARTAASSLIKAMSGWRLGQFQSARLDWTAACELIHAKSQQGLNIGGTVATMFPGTPQDLQGSWYGWVMADLLRRECDEVIAPSDQSLEATSKSNTFSQETLMILSRELGEWHAIRGEWEQARNRFEYVHRFSPSRADAVRVDYLSALASLKLGDEKGFLSLRDEAISRFKGTTDAADAEYVIAAGLLRPVDNTSAAALEPYAQVLERAVAGAGQLKEGTTTPAASRLALLGLFAYRRGDYAEALKDCQRSLAASTYLAMPSAVDRAIRAMSFHKLGEDASARSELDSARSLLQNGLNIGFDQWNWNWCVFVRLLLQEADSMIPQAPSPQPGAAPR
jgi:tetratricopeptide (TPR) repeat protein